MALMVGPNSMMRQIINMLKVNLLNATCTVVDGTVATSPDDCRWTATQVDTTALAQLQWGAGSFLGDTAYYFMGLSVIDSVDSALFVADIFTTQPEFGYWLAHDGAL